MERRLPIEIIEKILSFEDLSISDVFSFSLTNRYHNYVIKNNRAFLRKKYFQTCPQLVEIIDGSNSNLNWYGELQYINDLKRRTRGIISSMVSRFFECRYLSDAEYAEWLEIYHEKPLTYYYLVQDLMNIVNTDVTIESIEVVPINTPGNKTQQYYAMGILRYLRQLHLSKEWQTFVASPTEQQTLEKVLAFIAQWYQPNVHVSCKYIADKLDKLAEEVTKHLKRLNRNHPFFGIQKKQQKAWRNENIRASCEKYKSVHRTQILLACETVFLHRSGGADYLINEILDKAGCTTEKFVETVMFESVARRLGMKCTVSFSIDGAQLIKHDDRDSDDYSEQDTIQVIAMHVALESKEVLRKSFSNKTLHQSYLELAQLIHPSCVPVKARLAKCYMAYKMNTTCYIELLVQQKNLAPQSMKQLMQIINRLKEYEAKIRRGMNHDYSLRDTRETRIRPPKLKYAVGMVMRYKELDYKCVICGWDVATFDIGGRSKYQTLSYEVLTENGSFKFAQQDDLEPSDDAVSLQSVDGIGRYFSHVFETHFVPNVVNEEKYPADTAVRHMYHQEYITKKRSLAVTSS